jgi:hypothetical protein
MKRLSKFIPMAVIAFGIVGALSSFTTSKDSKLAINIPGFIKANPLGTVCNTSVMCASDFDVLCTSGTTQVWGKDASGKCVVELYRNHN